MDYLLPRFSLKHATRVERLPAGADTDLAFTSDPTGQAVFTGVGHTWYLDRLTETDTAQTFTDWLLSEVGGRAVTGFQSDGVQIFQLPQPEEVTVARIEIDLTLAAEGADLALVHCGRCHVVSEANRMKAIGSTPSFALIRTFDDWDIRFQTFYVLKPHPAFTQIADVTDAFDPARPSPIVPLRISAEELEAIIAYVAAVEPADLGAVLQFQ
jgi:mono/diheme cytochrome c family protein